MRMEFVEGVFNKDFLAFPSHRTMPVLQKLQEFQPHLQRDAGAEMWSSLCCRVELHHKEGWHSFPSFMPARSAQVTIYVWAVMIGSYSSPAPESGLSVVDIPPGTLLYPRDWIDAGRSRSAGGAVRAAEIVGLLALESDGLNRDVAACRELLVELVPLIASEEPSVSRAVINAVDDLGITAAGRRALHKCGVVNYILNLLVSFPDSLLSDSDLEEHFADVLRVADALLQHPEVTLQKVPRAAAYAAYSKLKKLWRDVLEEDEDEDDEEESSSTRHLVARMLAFFGLELLPVDSRDGHSHSCEFLNDKLMEKNWEKSAVLADGSWSLIEALRAEFQVQDQDPSQLLRTLVGSSVSCPPASSDELDPYELFKEIHDDLGKRLIYQHDIRLIKSRHGIEQHYSLRDTGGSKEQTVRIEDCLEAFHLGYTVAIRGMEFRSQLVADLARSLCLQLGQASIGANLYLTPPDAQGLALHYDDHCVFVVQVSGRKRWSLSPSPTVLLPRLYAPRIAPELAKHDLIDMTLTEGSVLYIPRGFAHQATTSEDCNDCSKDQGEGKRKFSALEMNNNCSTASKFSLHLTFGVELEPPFEWQGFIHIALHFWFLRTMLLQNQNQNQNQDGRLCKMLLHFTVTSLADSAVPGLRKACTVAMPVKEDPHETVKELVKQIAAHAVDSESTVNRAECASVLSWLVHLPGTESLETDLRLALHSMRMNEDTKFREMYSSFRDEFLQQALDDEAVFREARGFFLLLLKKYRTSRWKHINAMLALHNISKD